MIKQELANCGQKVKSSLLPDFVFVVVLSNILYFLEQFLVHRKVEQMIQRFPL